MMFFRRKKDSRDAAQSAGTAKPRRVSEFEIKLRAAIDKMPPKERMLVVKTGLIFLAVFIVVRITIGILRLLNILL
jgi:hypothetical protein